MLGLADVGLGESSDHEKKVNKGVNKWRMREIGLGMASEGM